jgi:hypothetical protein
MNLIIIITSHRILRFIWNKLRILSVLLEILLGHLIIVMILLLLNRQCLSVISLLIILKIFIYLYLYLRVLRHSIHRLSVINNRLRRRNSIRCLWSIYYLVINYMDYIIYSWLFVAIIIMELLTHVLHEHICIYLHANKYLFSQNWCTLNF